MTRPSTPLSWPFLIVLMALLAALESLFLLGLAEYASARMGLSADAFGLLLLASLAGSAIDIPLARLPPAWKRTTRLATAFGVTYVVPVVERRRGVVIAVNVGGALIPAGLAVYLLAETGAWVRGSVAILLVTLVVHRVAQVIPGLGVAVPGLLPPVVAGAAGLFLGGSHEAAIAYAAGTLGTLIGADLLNLGNLRALRGEVASIGGAGTFDGVFLSGLGAAVIAALA